MKKIGGGRRKGSIGLFNLHPRLNDIAKGDRAITKQPWRTVRILGKLMARYIKWFTRRWNAEKVKNSSVCSACTAIGRNGGNIYIDFTGEDRGGEHARLIGFVAKNFVRVEFDGETFQRRRFESIEFQRRRGVKPCLRIVRKFTRTDGGCRPLRLVVKMTVRH